MFIALPLIAIIGSWYFIEMKKHSEIFIPNIEPSKVFKVFGNFTNFFILEPHLIRFKLKAEFDGHEMVTIPSGSNKYNEFRTMHRDRLLQNHQEWSYVVWYEEYYQYLPTLLTNKNEGHYILSMKRFDQKSGDVDVKNNEEVYEVRSIHKTEYLTDRPIITQAVNTFQSAINEKDEVGTLVIEDVFYESPLLFVPLAFAEVQAQRPKVLNVLANWQYK